jgi:hypothetical protein
MKKILSALIFMAVSTLANGQILISILLGDKLNSDKIEFGLDGGLASTGIHGLDPSGRTRALHLGFYFDFKISETLLFHTGVIVKSTMGAAGLPSYAIGDATLDPVLSTASVKRKISYFSVPLLLKARLPYHFSVEAGPQLGLYYNSRDEFVDSRYTHEDVLFRNNTKGQYTRIDAGVTGGIGYRLLKGTGVTIGARYYQGLVDIVKDNTGPKQLNSAFYLFGAIPIGGVKKTAGN